MSELNTNRKEKNWDLVRIIKEVSALLGAAPDLEQVLEYTLNAGMWMPGADAASVYVFDPAKKELQLFRHRGASEGMAEDVRLKLGNGVAGYVAKSGRSMLVSDADNEPRYMPYRKKVRSVIAVPVMDQGRLVGVISADSSSKGAFGKEELQALETIAVLAGHAIKNTRIFAERDNRIKELDIINRINHVFSQTMDLRRAFDQVVVVLKKELKMERATLVLLDTETGELEIKIADGLTGEQIKRGRYHVGEGITGEVVRTGKTIGVPDISKEPRFLDRTGARLGLKVTKTLSFMCVPIKLEEQVIGVLTVDREFESNEQFQRDLQFLDIISSSLAQAVHIHMLADEARKELEDRNIYLRGQLTRKFSFANIIGQSEPMQEVFQRIQMVAKSKATVLIRGESGTGKELVAKAIHFNSEVKDKPFIKVDCATIPETLLESELFGHTRGSFTGAIADKKGKFEVADGGTIFLDEIGEMSTALQAKFLRVLQERVIEPIGSNKPRAISVRVIAATNKDLEKLMTEGKFREDLYYRLNVVPVYIPTLRARKSDIPYLAENFLERFNKENKKEHRLSPELLEEFMAYDWPGNVRELENLIERLVIMSEEKILTPGKVALKNRTPEAALAAPAHASEQRPLADLEKDAVLKALKQAGGSQVDAANILGITLRRLRYRMQKYHIRKNFVSN
jgi:Nif-specific regulatory protein